MSDAEADIRAHHDAGELEAAATLALETYGPEVLRYVGSMVRDPVEAGEIFSELSEDLWKGLPSFAWRSSMRTWLYTLARHATSRHFRGAARKPERNVPLSKVSDVAARVRTATLPYLRTDVKDSFRALRDALEPDDRTLLVLRVDRRMPWQDIAVVFEGADADDATLKRTSARLRKRFQKLKEELRVAAKRAGLLDS